MLKFLRPCVSDALFQVLKQGSEAKQRLCRTAPEVLMLCKVGLQEFDGSSAYGLDTPGQGPLQDAAKWERGQQMALAALPCIC